LSSSFSLVFLPSFSSMYNSRSASPAVSYPESSPSDTELEAVGPSGDDIATARASFDMRLPPDNTDIGSFAEFTYHFISSPTIFSAIQGCFGTTSSLSVLTKTVDETSFLDFVHQNMTQEHQFNHTFSLGPSVMALFFPLFHSMNWLGICVLAEVYATSLSDPLADVGDLKSRWNAEMSSLAPRLPPSTTQPASVPASKQYEIALSSAFNQKYVDPHNLVTYYCRKISNNLLNWTQRPRQYVAPYSSVITSSMMGKSRLIKQISMNIPTVYICVRERNDGYPTQSKGFMGLHPREPRSRRRCACR
jgi:hypothetical protein